MSGAELWLNQKHALFIHIGIIWHGNANFREKKYGTHSFEYVISKYGKETILFPCRRKWLHLHATQREDRPRERGQEGSHKIQKIVPGEWGVGTDSNQRQHKAFFFSDTNNNNQQNSMYFLPQKKVQMTKQFDKISLVGGTGFQLQLT